MRLRLVDRQGGRQGNEICLPWAVALRVLVLACAIWVVGCGDPTSEARELEKAGDWEGALAVYESVLARDSDNVNALSGAAVALVVLRRYDEALGLQERVVETDPQDAQTRVELGFNYLNHQGRPVDAVRVLTEAVGLEPTAKNMTFLAQAQREADDERGAEQSLRQAIATDPDYGYAYSQLVGLLAEQGRTDDVVEVIENARSRGLDVSEPR